MVVGLERCLLAIFALSCGTLGCSPRTPSSSDGDSGIDVSDSEGEDAADEGAGTGGSSSDADGSTGEGSDDDATTSSSAEGTTTSNDDASETGNDNDETQTLLPAGVRRLTTHEYRASIEALFGIPLPENLKLPPDGKQDGFSRNHAQRIDPVLAKQLDRNASWVAQEVAADLDRLAPCSSDEATCAQTFIETYGALAFRRALDAQEQASLLELYDTGRQEGSHADGLELVVRALLQSAGFLYLTELGEPGREGDALQPMTGNEIAASLSYLATGRPPDEALRLAASAGELSDPDLRLEHFDRLVWSDGRADATVVRLLREWLGIEGVSEIAKDSQVYPRFQDLRASMNQETLAFIDEVLAGEGTLEALLGADWSIIDSTLAGAYGVSGEGRVSLAATPRRGILNQAAFLSVYAHAHESAPILRGVAILRRVLCYPTPSPTTLNLMVVPPLPDPNKTTRERFEIHSADPACAACHRSIDNVGFTFEGFDGMGMARPNGMEHGQPVDTATELAVGLDVDGTFADSAELAAAIASSEDARVCFARHMFHAMTARSDEPIDAAEDAFIAHWRTTPRASDGDILETLRSYVASEQFIMRRGQ